MSRKKKKKPPKGKKNGKIPIGGLQRRLKEIFIANPGESYSYRQLIKLLRLRDMKSKDALKDMLFGMEAKDQIRRKSDGRFVSLVETEAYEGTVDHVNARFAYIVCDEVEEDIWVRTEDLNFAIDKDRVEVQVIRPASDGFRAEGKVLRIISRHKTDFVGRIEISEKYSFVVPDNRNLHFDVFVYPEKILKAKHNDKVIVTIKKWHDRGNKSPLGEVIQVLGAAGENETEIHSIMAEFGLPFEFPDKVEQAANKFSDQIDPEELKYRRDFREITTFTVDPIDAKDFDDALSIQEIGKGKYEIGVHIADVSHYVEPKTILDIEALERATSVYLVDRTIPMLPEKLSNGLCSLRPDEEKLVFSAIFEMDSKAKVTKKSFGRSIIKSNRRFTYEEAQERIEKKEGDFAGELEVLNSLAKQLKDKRFKDGAVNFETVEVRFQLDEQGKPLAVVPKERKDAHKMIEEFMLLANREVATFIYKRKEGKQPEGSSTFVYRTHDDPDPEKLESFSQFAAKFGHKLTVTGAVSKSLNKLMNDIEGRPEQNVLESLAIRSMAKARYTTDPRGHFGLAFEHYTHFTSPIRRYPDVMVHRLLWEYLGGNKSPDRESYEKKCVHSSEREKRAAEAERASIKYKQVEFMTSMLGEEFQGIVSGVTEWGVFVEIIQTKCEGMVRLADMDDDHYEFDEKQFRVIGKRHGRIISLGDEVKVQVVKTDIDRRTIDLLLVESKP
ncbi:MAG: ribonuclease R [Cyclobacteriaceae bacterium]|nr:ribonuclease R [Cyclobacteriaceae bacterium HetDA_MAG_MS6]